VTYTPGGAFGLLFLVLFAAIVVALTPFIARSRRKSPADPLPLRPIDGYSSLPRAIGEAVETGRRLHISLGSGAVGGAETAAVLAGLTIVERLAQAASISDRPPVVTSGDSVAAILAQDTLRGVYNQQNLIERYDPNSARLAGPTPFSYAAGAMLTVPDETVAANILAGSFGSEIAAAAEAGMRAGITQVAGASDPAAQAVAYAAAEHPLIGEELYVAGAYLRQLPSHIASVYAQDAMRLLIVVAFAALVLARALGFW
jgi:hypothetical protein